jgi:hypothetical protein
VLSCSLQGPCHIITEGENLAQMSKGRGSIYWPGTIDALVHLPLIHNRSYQAQDIIPLVHDIVSRMALNITMSGHIFSARIIYYFIHSVGAHIPPRRRVSPMAAKAWR